MKRIFLFLAATVAIIGLASCSRGYRKAILPNVSGKAGEVIVVIEKADWEGALGNEVRELLAADCPWLYIREPLYSVVNVPPGAFADMFKIHRNIVLFQIADAGVRIDAGLCEDLGSGCLTDPVDIGQADLDSLISRKVYASNTCHIVSLPP